MIRNAHYYDQNTAREYPLTDQATATSVKGVLLPTDIIADLNMRYPEHLGAYPFVASVAVTPGLVSVTFQVASDPNDSSTFSPLAVVSLPRPVNVWRHYPLQAQVPGVGGWIVFGGGIEGVFSGRFLPAGGLLAPRAARSYHPLPVSSLGILSNRTALAGVVRLQAESPLEIVAEDREIRGVLRTVAVIRLVEAATTATAANDQANSVFRQFSGPCSNRPESGNCGTPVPIEYINAIQPDCDGNITFELRGCAKLGALTNDAHSVIIDCSQGLAQACLPDRLPDANGKLRNDYDDKCDIVISESLFPISESM